MINNLDTLRDALTKAVSKKFHEHYPEIFKKANSLDEKEIKKSPEGYELYIKYMNASHSIITSPSYKIESYDFHEGISDAQKMIDDALKCSDILKFCFLNIPLKD